VIQLHATVLAVPALTLALLPLTLLVRAMEAQVLVKHPALEMVLQAHRLETLAAQALVRFRLPEMVPQVPLQTLVARATLAARVLVKSRLNLPRLLTVQMVPAPLLQPPETALQALHLQEILAAPALKEVLAAPALKEVLAAPALRETLALKETLDRLAPKVAVDRTALVLPSVVLVLPQFTLLSFPLSTRLFTFPAQLRFR